VLDRCAPEAVSFTLISILLVAHRPRASLSITQLKLVIKPHIIRMSFSAALRAISQPRASSTGLVATRAAALRAVSTQPRAFARASSTGLATIDRPARVWRVYLSGEIHSAWRAELAAGVRARKLPIELSSPNPSHADSDDCGAIILGMEERCNPNPNPN
jgi:hypothetical protein